MCVPTDQNVLALVNTLASAAKAYPVTGAKNRDRCVTEKMPVGPRELIQIASPPGATPNPQIPRPA